MLKGRLRTLLLVFAVLALLCVHQVHAGRGKGKGKGRLRSSERRRRKEAPSREALLERTRQRAHDVLSRIQEKKAALGLQHDDDNDDDLGGDVALLAAESEKAEASLQVFSVQQDEPTLCCLALTLTCSACSAGVTESEYCEEFPEMYPAECGTFQVPSEWTCNPSWYSADDGCDCDCGAWDPDCDQEDAFGVLLSQGPYEGSLYWCNEGEYCENAGEQGGVCVAQQTCGGYLGGVPLAPVCPLGEYCSNINSSDPPNGFCAEKTWCDSDDECQDGEFCNGMDKCVPRYPDGWTCGDYYNANDGCDCNCGVWDPDCDLYEDQFVPPGQLFGCDGMDQQCQNTDGGVCVTGPRQATPDDIQTLLTFPNTEEETERYNQYQELMDENKKLVTQYETCPSQGNPSDYDTSELDWIENACSAGGRLIDGLCEEKIRFPVGLKDNSRYVEKEVCLFGVCKKVGADIPGLPPFIFDFEDVSLCDIPQRLGVGGIIPIRDLASSAVGLCNCLKPFLNLMAKYGEEIDSLDTTQMSGKALAELADVAQCAIENLGEVYEGENQDEVTQSLRADTNVIVGPPIDLSFYMELLTIPFSGGATTEVVLGNYFDELLQSTKEGLKEWVRNELMNPIEPILETLKAFEKVEELDEEKIQDCKTAIQEVAEDQFQEFLESWVVLQATLSQIAELPTKLKEVQAELEGLFEQFEEFASGGLFKIMGASPEALYELVFVEQDMAAPIRQLIEAPDSIINGVKTFENLISGDLFEDAKKNIDFLTERAQTFSNLAEDLPQELKDQCDIGPILEVMDAVNTLVGNDDYDPFEELRKLSIGNVEDFLNPRVVSYSHRLKFGGIDLPCYEGTDTVDLFGLPFSYPKFARCTNDLTIPLPNGHIPVLEIGS